jgi:hypothetical protein
MTIECQACGCENTTEAGSKCFVCGSTLEAFDRAEADRLTKKYTAAKDFATFLSMMGTYGNQKYTPTIYPTNAYKGRKVAGKVKLAELVRSFGFKVYDGSKVS